MVGVEKPGGTKKKAPNVTILPHLKINLWLLFMKEIQIVGSSNGQNIVPRVPLSVQDLTVEVQAVNTHLVLAFPRCGCDPLVAQDTP